MLTSKKEAALNWCPMAPQPPMQSGVGLAAPAVTPPRCRVDDCMMWRWGDNSGLRQKFVSATGEGAVITRTQPAPARPRDVPMSWEWCPYDTEEGDGAWAGWREPEREMLLRLVGFCGLAGTPIVIATKVEVS